MFEQERCLYLAWMALAATFLTYCMEKLISEVVITEKRHFCKLHLYLLVTGLVVETEGISLVGVALQMVNSMK